MISCQFQDRNIANCKLQVRNIAKFQTARSKDSQVLSYKIETLLSCNFQYKNIAKLQNRMIAKLQVER